MRGTLRFITCGSVDDGKSTLIGRLLWESKQVFDDQLSVLKKDSVRYGTQGDATDLALLLDGLQAEREQSITIDVAYRFFSTPQRRFVVADTPGHEQYTPNMATGASTSDLAVLVVNASEGLQIQTHRHARIVAMLGIRHLAIAVNKMDLVAWDEGTFSGIVREFEPVAKALGFVSCQPIPLSALNGDNVTESSSASPWYSGPSLLHFLEEVDVTHTSTEVGFRMPVQWVNRSNPDFRGYCGRVASGGVRVGDRVRVLPGGNESKVKAIVTWQQEPLSAIEGESITICLEDQIDITRGSIISSAANPPGLSDQFQARVICLSSHPLIAGRSYVFYLHTCQAAATITAVKYKVDVKQGTQLAAQSLAINDIGVVNLSLDRQVAFEAYGKCERLGSFLLIDRLDNQTVAAGMIEFALGRAANIYWQTLDIDKVAHAKQKLQKPMCLWFTGLSGSGKSTIANLLEKRLFASGRHTYILDGDNIRHGLNSDLGFSVSDRVENIRRVTEVARLLVDAGLIVIVSFISPFRAEREFARTRFESGEFFEIFVDTPLDECERRDPKGLYAKARRGELTNLTGIDSDYELPSSAEIRLDTLQNEPDKCVDKIMKSLTVPLD